MSLIRPVFFRPLPGAAFRPAGAQATGQLATELTAARHEQGLVDRLVAHLHHGIARELDPQPAGDLLRRPPGLQPPGDLRGQRARELGDLRATRAPAGALMSPPRPVPRPPLPATSRDTVEAALPSRAAITAHAPPACRPRLISSRSAKVSRPGPGTHGPAPRCGRLAPPRAMIRTSSCEQPTCGPICLSDQPLALSRNARDWRFPVLITWPGRAAGGPA
jgi:hypothetical protein